MNTGTIALIISLIALSISLVTLIICNSQEGSDDDH